MALNNQITLIGHLGDTPQAFTNGKTEYVRLSIATTDSYKTEQGEWVNKPTVWHTAFAFGTTVQSYAKKHKKGDRVKVTGSLSYRKTEATIDGEKRTFNNATVILSRIDAAPLPRKQEAA